MQCRINGKEYTYHTDIRENDGLRRSFSELSSRTFGLSFEAWYENGYWGDRYIPHALSYGDRVVANVSVNRMDIVWNGRDRRYIQLGTVMTDPGFRNNGLARFLLESVLEEWKDRCDAVYLFANDTVLDFYPRFGFIKAGEYQYGMPVRRKPGRLRKLDMSDGKDRELLLQKYRGRIRFPRFR